VKAAFLALILAGSLSSGLAQAQSAVSCADCINAAACNATRDSCAAECRARLFSIDPRRESCITGCSGTAAQCAQAATVACREKAQCR